MNREGLFEGIRKVFKFGCILLIGAGVILAAQESRAQEAGVGRIAVMPFIKGKHPENVAETMTCPYSSFCFEDDSIKEGAEQTLTRMLQSMVEREFSGQVIPLAVAVKSFEILKIDHATDTPMAVLLTLGETLEADYMMAGNVWRYTERRGTSFSAEKPASVAFAVYLVDMKTRNIIWSDHYDKTQQALTENLFNVKDFFKQGVQWLTAEELAAFGMNKMFEDFPLK